jgi:hypothetical protein
MVILIWIIFTVSGQNESQDFSPLYTSKDQAASIWHISIDYLSKKLFKSLYFFLLFIKFSLNIKIIGTYFLKFSYKNFLQLSYKKIDWDNIAKSI